MKENLVLSGLVLLGTFIVAIVLYLAPAIMEFFPNVSYRYVLFFLMLIVASNILAKVAYKYISA